MNVYLTGGVMEQLMCSRQVVTVESAPQAAGRLLKRIIRLLLTAEACELRLLQKLNSTAFIQLLVLLLT